MPPILVEATSVRLGYAIFAVATLSFIGFGLQPPSPDWAVQIADDPRGSRVRVVVGALPRARHRIARRSRSTSSRIGSAGARAIGEVAALELRDLDVVYTVRGRDRQVLARRLLRDRPRRVVRPCGRVGMWEVDCSAGDRALPFAERARFGGVDLSVAGRDVLALAGGGLRGSAPRPLGLDGLPEPRRGPRTRR